MPIQYAPKKKQKKRKPISEYGSRLSDRQFISAGKKYMLPCSRVIQMPSRSKKRVHGYADRYFISAGKIYKAPHISPLSKTKSGAEKKHSATKPAGTFISAGKVVECSLQYARGKHSSNSGLVIAKGSFADGEDAAYVERRLQTIKTAVEQVRAGLRNKAPKNSGILANGDGKSQTYDEALELDRMRDVRRKAYVLKQNGNSNLPENGEIHHTLSESDLAALAEKRIGNGKNGAHHTKRKIVRAEQENLPETTS